MTPNDINLGTRLELELLNRQGEKVGTTYVSQLLEHQSDGLLVISSPIHEARLVFIPKDINIRLTFIHGKHGLLGFKAVVTDREHRGNIAMLLIRPDSEIIIIQRRMNYRLDMVGDVQFWLDAESNPIKAYSKNISGSGLCIVTEKNIPVDSVIKAELDLQDLPVFSAGCRVLRSKLLESKRGKQFELGLCFMEIAKKDQDNLIRYIFEQQRLILKKEN